jgi:uncharacterized protein (TIGR02246 family)
MRVFQVILLMGLTTVTLAQERAPAPAPAPAATATAVSSEAEAEAFHAELRTLRDDMVAAIKNSDFDAMTQHLHPNVVFTPMNGEVSRGPEAIRAYFDKMVKGPDAIVTSISLDLEVDRGADLYGNTAVAFGSSNDHYTLNNGMDFPIQTRWTCALTRENGKWLITAFHASANVFDNPVLAQANQAAMLKWGGIGVAAGALVGGLLGVVIAGRRRS